MRLLAYGEDALTLWVLTHRLPEFLRHLGDYSDPEAVLVLYRPSFGRSGGGSESAGDTVRPRNSQFGEFDAIVATPRGVYLVESKWSRPGTRTGEPLTLRREQWWRHTVMKWYIDAWRRASPEHWTAFAENAGDAFRREFPTMDLPPLGSALSRNLEYVLRQLSAFDVPAHDVLLFACAPGAEPPRIIDPAHFRLVCIGYPLAGGAGFVEIPLQPPSVL